MLLGLLTASYGAGAFGVLGVSPLSPALHDAFALSRFEVGLILPAAYVGGILFSLPGGRLADRWGVRASLAAGLALAAAGTLAAAVAPGFAWFLACIVMAGFGWSVVNPALGKAIIAIFPVHERGLAMGIKQMGLMLGGVASALVLPPVAAASGWRTAMVVSAAAIAGPFALAWRALAPCDAAAPPAAATASAPARGTWWWLGRPALLVLFGAGLTFGMVQAAVLGFLPLYSIQVLGFDAVAAGVLLAAAQAGGAIARVGLGIVSDRSAGGTRAPFLVLTALLAAAVFLLYAVGARAPLAGPALAGLVAFLAGVGAFGWVGLFLLVAAEVGGARQAGLLTGVAMAFIVTGILVGAPTFGAILEGTDSYAVAWGAFAGLALATAAALFAAAGPVQREADARARLPVTGTSG